MVRRFIANLFAASLCTATVLFAASCADASKAYNDESIYTEQKFYCVDEFGQKVYHTGISAMYFIPEYEKLEYEYDYLEFYIFDGTATMVKTAITFVLDLYFNDQDAYKSAKDNELETRTFMTEYPAKKWYENPEFEFSIGDFFCKTVYDDNYPRRFGLICYNDDNFVLRYLYFEEWEAPEYVQNKDYIAKCTNCPWN